MLININATLAEATRRVKNREVSYTWRSNRQDIQLPTEVEGDLVGALVRLTIRHDADAKAFTSTIRFMNWNDRSGYVCESFTIFDKVNYPASNIITKSVARYSDKALAEFEADVLAQLGTWARQNEVVGNLWARATEIAMGGDGTLRYSEAVSM